MRRTLTLWTGLVSLLAGCGAPSPIVTLESTPATESALTTGTHADAIIGQLSERATAQLRTDAGSFRSVGGVAVGNGHLYVADTGNQRVLGFSDVASLNSSEDFGANADLVLLQPDAFVSDHRNIPTTPINHYIAPNGVEVDAEGRLYMWNSANVLVFDDPYENDAVADYQLGGEPGTIRSVRSLGNNKLAVVGENQIVFYERGSQDPYAQAAISSPCGADLYDIAATNNAFFVACLSNVLDSADTFLVSGIFVFEIDDVTGLPALDPGSSPVGYRAYTDMGAISSVAVVADYLLVADSAGNRVIRFDGASNHASSVIGTSGATAPEVPSTTGNAIYGQPNATSVMPNYDPSATPTVSANGLWAPIRISVDASDRRMWLADLANYRVLGFSDTGVTNPAAAAQVVLGQGDMNHNLQNRLEPSSFASVVGVAVGTNGSGGLRAAVADQLGNRVLVWNDLDAYSAGTAADQTLGQASGLDTAVNRGAGTVVANGLNSPLSAAIDPSGDPWVNDRGNRRIVHFTPGNANASEAFGAAGTTSTGLFDFYGFALTANHLFVAAGSRVFMYDRTSPGEAPSRVFGQDQPAAATPTVIANACNRGGGPRADTLCSAMDVAVDGDGTLWVADTSNNRVLWFEDPTSNDVTAAVTADGVVGQPDFVSNSDYAGLGYVGPFAVRDPYGIAVDDAGTLWVLDRTDSRVLVFADPKTRDPEVGLPMAATVLGQRDDRSRGANNDTNGVNARTLSSPISVAVDPTGSTALIADTGNARALRFVDNRPPVIDDPGRHEVARGSTSTVELSVSDPEQDSIVVEALDPLPPGASLDGTTVTYAAPETAPFGTIARVNVVATDQGVRPQSTSATVVFVVVDRIASTRSKPAPRALREPDGCAASSSGAAAFAVLLTLPLLLRKRRQDRG